MVSSKMRVNVYVKTQFKMLVLKFLAPKCECALKNNYFLVSPFNHFWGHEISVTGKFKKQNQFFLFAYCQIHGTYVSQEVTQDSIRMRITCSATQDGVRLLVVNF